jgi:hypothetical protein
MQAIVIGGVALRLVHVSRLIVLALNEIAQLDSKNCEPTNMRLILGASKRRNAGRSYAFSFFLSGHLEAGGRLLGSSGLTMSLGSSLSARPYLGVCCRSSFQHSECRGGSKEQRHVPNNPTDEPRHFAHLLAESRHRDRKKKPQLLVAEAVHPERETRNTKRGLTRTLTYVKGRVGGASVGIS